VEFVVDKVALGQVFSEYFGFPCQSSFHQFLHYHPGLVQQASSGRSTQSPTAQLKKNAVCKSTDIFRNLRLNVNNVNLLKFSLFIFVLSLCLSYCCSCFLFVLSP
jgi:hypothetical protein